MPYPYKTTLEIVKANKKAGYYFFDEKTMELYTTAVVPGVYGGKYFIINEYSERGNEESKPLFYVCVIGQNPDHPYKVNYVNRKKGWKTLERAQESANKHAAKENS